MTDNAKSTNESVCESSFDSIRPPHFKLACPAFYVDALLVVLSFISGGGFSDPPAISVQAFVKMFSIVMSPLSGRGPSDDFCYDRIP